MTCNSPSPFLRPTSALSLPPRSGARLGRLYAALCLAGLPGIGQALDFGPNGMFSLTGFAEVSVGAGSNQCKDCQLYPTENKQRIWADELIQGAKFDTETSAFSQIQPYLGFKYDLGKGVKLSGLLSQRWRDGEVDVKGYWYEKNVAVSHEDFGSLRIGAMTTRGWSVADYPYGTNVGVASAWGSSGAGYGMLTGAVRYTSRILDVADGDLVVEGTYDRGNTAFKINKPSFMELYTQFHKGDLVMDATLQHGKNGTPMAWSHGPFTGLTPFANDDSKLTGSDQGMAMLMARYQVTSQWEVSGGIRRNYWSGANAVMTGGNTWNEMFNVDWDGVRSGVSNPGYSARSTDLMLGVLYRMGQWTASTGMVYLGKAKTANPSERGQSNSALINTAGLKYDYGQGVQFNVQTGMVHYGRIGLSPMSAPDNQSFTKIDSRVTDQGNWFTVGLVYSF